MGGTGAGAACWCAAETENARAARDEVEATLLVDARSEADREASILVDDGRLSGEWKMMAILKTRCVAPIE